MQALIANLKSSSSAVQKQPIQVMNVHKGRYEFIVTSDDPQVFLLPQNFSFVSVQAIAIDGNIEVGYTLDNLGSVTDGKVNVDGTHFCDWKYGTLSAGESQIDFFEHSMTAVLFTTTGKAKGIVIIKDGLA